MSATPELEELERLYAEATVRRAVEGWRIYDSHIFDWMAEQHVHVDTVALIRALYFAFPSLASSLRAKDAEIAELRERIVKADTDMLGAEMVLENKTAAAAGALAEADWRPERVHIEGMRNTMKEALEYLSDARTALDEEKAGD